MSNTEPKSQLISGKVLEINNSFSSTRTDIVLQQSDANRSTESVNSSERSLASIQRTTTSEKKVISKASLNSTQVQNRNLQNVAVWKVAIPDNTT
jgi:hypothetical protein